MTLEQFEEQLTIKESLDSTYQRYLTVFHQIFKQNKTDLLEKFYFTSNNDVSLNFRQRSLLNNRQEPKTLEYIN